MITYMKSEGYVDFEEATAERVKNWSPEAKALWAQLQLEVEAKQLRIALTYEIASARESLGLSQRALADLAAVSQRDVSHIEQGKANPTLTTLVKLLSVLGLKFEITPK